MILTNVRFSYLTIFEPRPNQSGDLKYSAAILIPKDHPQVKEIENEIAAAKAKGIEKNLFTEAQTKAQRFKKCLRDGTEEHASGERGPEYNGMYFINAINAAQPGIVDENVRPLLDPNKFWSGCWGNVDVGFYPFNKGGGIGVGCALNNIMKTKEDERLDGRLSADKAFDGFKPPVEEHE